MKVNKAQEFSGKSRKSTVLKKIPGEVLVVITTIITIIMIIIMINQTMHFSIGARAGPGTEMFYGWREVQALGAS